MPFSRHHWTGSALVCDCGDAAKEHPGAVRYWARTITERTGITLADRSRTSAEAFLLDPGSGSPGGWVATRGALRLADGRRFDLDAADVSVRGHDDRVRSGTRPDIDQ